MGFNSGFKGLNPICHLLALLGAHPILHVSRIRVKHSMHLVGVIEEMSHIYENAWNGRLQNDIHIKFLIQSEL